MHFKKGMKTPREINHTGMKECESPVLSVRETRILGLLQPNKSSHLPK